MRILAIDTATNACSAALLTEDGVFECFEVAPRGHTRLLLPMIEDVLKQGQTRRGDLTAIAFVAGPGSFTGIRIATSMAQGLSLGLDIPVIPLSSLLVLACGARRKFRQSEIFPYIDARREQVYWAHYSFEADSDNDFSLATEPRVIVADRLTKLDEMVGAITPGALTYGSGEAEYMSGHCDGETGQYPRASDALAIAATRLNAGKAAAPGDAQAIYFRRGL
jgi:tRNA threonylcarbamoyladenosine biosynthesis protein TsaB